MVFKRAQNWDSNNDGSWTVSGSEFHKVRPETAKLCCPYLIVLERDTADLPCAADWRWVPCIDVDTYAQCVYRRSVILSGRQNWKMIEMLFIQHILYIKTCQSSFIGHFSRQTISKLSYLTAEEFTAEFHYRIQICRTHDFLCTLITSKHPMDC